ncbi:MAG TPA: signal peptidase I [Thermoanaerobaculia bacterium]|nr:signal peptidase I [Thermoanaerobaculia bacterium]
MPKSPTPEETSHQRKADGQPPKSILREYAEAFIIAAIFLRFANTFVVQTFYIPSGSMENTLLVGDHLFVNRYIYGPHTAALDRLLPGRAIRRGDIVVFRSPEDPNLDLVKRCIGLPGDQIDVADKQLYINGKKVDDATYALHKDVNLYPDRPFFNEQGRIRDNFGPYTVPPGDYFCMGDNRDFSYDSRFWGPLPAHMVKGRASMIYWSYGGETSDGRWPGWGAKLRQIGRTLLGFFTKTRWSRSFLAVR